MSENPLEVDEIFNEALQRPKGTDRENYLAQACGDDNGKRKRVDRLLQAVSDAGDFLESPAQDPGETIDQPTSKKSGDKIGPYKLLEEIGEGGMGTVWVASQTEPIKRKVAIKLIKAGMDTKQVLARFEAERQALAMMDHPNIARVLDGGMTDDGRPYFAMEYVKGVPLTEYCDSSKLSIRDRLELFLQICQAVQHAHQKGIIHRDLKPSNILICLYDGKPVPKVIDFGLAKAIHHSLTDQSIYTSHGMMIGTPLYMSPEQAEQNNLDIDTRSDVYSLGVILYELLTGSTPLEKAQMKNAAYNEILRLIKEVEPLKPSTRISGSDSLPSVAAQRSIDPRQLSKSVTGDLDWVVMKALEKERSRRYETTNGLAEDIRRHLCDEPVSAGPPSSSYRIRKFIKRNRTGFLAASAVMVTLFLGIIGTTTGMFWAFQAREDESRAKLAAIESAALAKRETTRAESERAKAEKQKVIAEENATREENARRRAQAINTFVVNSLQLGNPVLSGKRDVTIVEAMENAISEIAAGVFCNEPEIEAELQSVISDILMSNFQYDQVETLLTQSLQTRTRVFGPDHPKLRDSLNELAKLRLWQGKGEEAEAFADRAIKLSSQLRDYTEIESLNLLASSHDMQGNYEEAEKIFLRAMKIVDEEGLVRGHHVVLVVMSNLADCYKTLGKITEAIELFNLVIATQEALYGSDHIRTMIARCNRATLLVDNAKAAEALPIFLEALEFYESTLPIDHPYTLSTRCNVATCYGQLRELEMSIPLLEGLVKTAKEKFGEAHPSTMNCMDKLGMNYRYAGRNEEAKITLERALELSKKNLGPQHRVTADLMITLGIIHKDLGDLSSAQLLHRQALALMEKRLPADHIKFDPILSTLGWIAWKEKKYDEAIRLYKIKQAIDEKWYGRENLSTIITVRNLGVNYRDAGHFSQAEPFLQRAVDDSRKFLGLAHPDTAEALNHLADLYRLQDQHDKAKPLLKEAAEVWEKVLESEPSDSISARNNLAWIYGALGESQKSIQQYEIIVIDLKAKLGPKNLNTQMAIANLGVTYTNAEHYSKAIPLLEEVHEFAHHYSILEQFSESLLTAYFEVISDEPEHREKAVSLTQYLLSRDSKTVPEESADRASCQAYYSMKLLQFEAWDVAEPTIRESLAIRVKIDPDSWKRYNSMALLGASLLGQEKYEEAEKMLHAGYEGMKAREKTIPPQGLPRLTDVLEHLVELYQATDKPDEAAKWQAELDKLSSSKPSTSNDS